MSSFKKVAIPIFLLAIILTGCSTAIMPQPMLYADYNTAVLRLQAPVGETLSVSKVGEAQAINVLGIIAIGDASVKTAMGQAGITKIHHADMHVHSLLWLFSEIKLKVYGE